MGLANLLNGGEILPIKGLANIIPMAASDTAIFLTDLFWDI